MSRVYADINATFGPSWYDYEGTHIEWTVPDNYEILHRVGGGRYSEVFRGIDMTTEDACIIKVLKPVAKRKIKREIKILRNLTGGPNIVGLLDVVHDPPSRSNSLIMEYVDNTDWKELYSTFAELEIKQYVFQLLMALDFVHSRGIMHRDVKPGNVMYDRQQRKLRLIDWGLAEFYHPGTEYHIRVGSRYYKAPELLTDDKKYDYSMDLWSVGCMLASMIFKREHFFRGKDNEDQLYRIIRVLGTDSFERYMQKYDLHISVSHPGLLESHPKQPWAKFVTSENRTNVTPEAVDLLDRLLRYDHYERLTASEAMAHAYFNIVRLGDATKIAEAVSDSGFCST